MILHYRNRCIIIIIIIVIIIITVVIAACNSMVLLFPDVQLLPICVCTHHWMMQAHGMSFCRMFSPLIITVMVITD